MRSEQEIDTLMNQILQTMQTRLCGGERGYAPMGCGPIGNRSIMAKEVGTPYRGDPEYIDERKIPSDVYQSLKITREEWENWMGRNS